MDDRRRVYHPAITPTDLREERAKMQEIKSELESRNNNLHKILSNIQKKTVFFREQNNNAQSRITVLEKEVKQSHSTIQTLRNEYDRGCVICMNENATVVMVPCGHMCVCRTCLQSSHVLSNCPICRAPIIKKQNVYMSDARSYIVPIL